MIPNMSASPIFATEPLESFRNRIGEFRTGWDLVLSGVLDDGDDTLELLSCNG